MKLNKMNKKGLIPLLIIIVIGVIVLAVFSWIMLGRLSTIGDSLNTFINANKVAFEIAGIFILLIIFRKFVEQLLMWILTILKSIFRF